MPAVAPRMTTADAFGRQPASRHRPVRTDRFGGVLRASWGKAAACRGSEQRRLQRRYRPPVHAHQRNQDELHRIHSPLSKPALRSVVIKSCSTSENFLASIDGRATSTRSTGWVNVC